MAVIDEENYLAHYGIIRRSGRYPWGSGGNSSEINNKGFLDWIKSLRSKGMTNAEIAEGLGVSTTDLKAQISISTNELYASNVVGAQRLKEKGLSNREIGERLGEPGKPIGEGTIRNWLKADAADKSSALKATSDMLRRQVDEKGVIDIGRGVESAIGVSPDRLKTAASMLKAEGYQIHNLDIPQVGTNGQKTKARVLAKPGITQKEVFLNQEMIRLINEHSEDGGHSFLGIKPPLAVDPKRVSVIYAEDGGDTRDGVIFVRPGVEDVSLGGTSYAQVRVQIGDGHYLKGMAIYKDDLPDGVDIAFNTNKSKSEVSNDFDAMKPLKRREETGEIDTDDPFGTVLKRQILADPNDRNSPVTSAMNLVYEEGSWSDWSNTIATQVLSKQEPKVAKRMLDASLERRQEEFDEIMSLTNPTVRAKLLREFSENADAASVHLKTAGFPRQGWHAILPVDNMAPTEIYAPNFRDGERVALIRYPHGGTFEIPELVVNNSNPGAKKIMDQAKDAVGIHHSVAERLSGADFDGDTVLVIPNNRGDIKSSPALEGLRDFKPREIYREYPGMKVMSNTQTEMGNITNLVTDMTIKGAPHSEIVRAVRHSMVVIDAEKHRLNYRESAKREGIKALKEKYQSGPDGKTGAATIVSRAKSREYVLDRKPRPAAEGGPIDPITGKKVYVPKGTIDNRTGQLKKIRSTQLAEADDARKLSSGTVIENLYAGYSNNLKALANRARAEMVKTPRLKYNASAREAYKEEVGQLNAALTLAESNAPRERRAQILARATISAKKQENPSMDEARLKKIKGQALTEARARTGAGKNRIEITPAQWDAIQAGAISDSKLERILNNSNIETVKKLATPKVQLSMTSSKTSRAKSMSAAGFTRSQVDDALGVSLSTLSRSVDDVQDE